MKKSEEQYTAKAREVLCTLFQDHGVKATQEGEIVVMLDDPEEPDFTYHLDCRIRNVSKQTNSMQLDVLLEMENGQTIVESFAGFGEDLESAFENCVQNFCLNSFHVILSTFFTQEYDDQVTVEEWSINGKARAVIMGNVVGRASGGELPEAVNTDWFPVLEEGIQALPLDDGDHWVRLFFAQQGGEQLALEVLLDNEPCDELVKKLRAFPWPSLDAFYSQRLFLIIMGV